MQAVVPVPQRREQRRVADALYKKTGAGGAQLRFVVVGAHVQVQAPCVLSRVESERLLAKYLHQAQRIHPAQVGALHGRDVVSPTSLPREKRTRDSDSSFAL